MVVGSFWVKSSVPGEEIMYSKFWQDSFGMKKAAAGPGWQLSKVTALRPSQVA